MAQKGEFFKRLAGAGANTMILFHGGNAFAPIMLPLENNMENITNCINKRWGKPGEVEIAHEQLKDLPKQTWGDVIKGRLSAWGLIFISFLAADTLIGKTSKGMPRFDAYEEWFGRWMAGFTKSGKTLGINNVPVHVPLNPLQDANKIYRLGKILALDLYATTAGIFIWNGISRGSAKKRHLKQNGKEATNGNEVTAPVQAPDTITEPAVETPSEPIPSEEKDVCKTLVCKASKEKTPSNFTTKLPSPDEEFSKTRIKEKTLAAEAQVSISA